MTPSEKARVKECVRELSEILYHILKKCCLCLSANESFLQAEQDLLLLTGMKVGHSTLQRQVHTETEHWDFPESRIAIDEVCLDGGKVRLRTKKGQKCEWQDYQAALLVYHQYITEQLTTVRPY